MGDSGGLEDLPRDPGDLRTCGGLEAMWGDIVKACRPADLEFFPLPCCYDMTGFH